MLSKKPRESKFRHLFGTPFQSVECSGGLKIGSIQMDANPLKANASFFAIPWGTGTVAVVPLYQKGAVSDLPLLVHEEKTVNDFAFAQTDDHLLATACSDGTVDIYRIPEGGLQGDVTKPDQQIQISDKRIMSLLFHPLASDVLTTIDAVRNVQLWDVATGSNRMTLPESHKAAPTSLSWNSSGNLLASSCKDKMLRLFDPRGNTVVATVEDHQGAKGAQNVWIGKGNDNEMLLTVGFGKGSDRQITIWDPRNMSNKVVTVPVDSGASTLFPFADRDLGLVYVAGKGDGNIRYYELGSDEPFLHYLNEFKSKDPQSGLSLLPKSNVDPTKCEVARFLKLTPQGLAVPIRFEVPRRENVFFQEDLFPNTSDRKASMTSEEWFGGANTEGKTVSLNPENK